MLLTIRNTKHMPETKLTFYPIGNADTTLIETRNGKMILFDYANMRCDDGDDKRIDLPKVLSEVVTGAYDVVCFTHADNDHICGFSDYFYLEYAGLYQSDQRKKINELWVPAEVLTAINPSDEARILRAETRYRLKNKRGIKVFSRPKKLKDWCDQQDDICYDDIKHLLVDAGSTLFNLATDNIEVFVHSPFASETQNADRNNAAVVVQITFDDRCQTKLLLGSDIDGDTWSDIVRVTRHFNRDERLRWDIFHISHHCSYKALNCGEKGRTETVPNDAVRWLLEEQANAGARIVSPSDVIVNEETTQPPHYQAANYYKRAALRKNGTFLVTMEYPKASSPAPLMFEINTSGCAQLKLQESAGAAFVTQRKAERAGGHNVR